MTKEKTKKIVSLCESLKTFVGQIFDDYHDGIVNNAEAKIKVWQEIELAFSRLSNKKIGNVLVIRSEIKSIGDRIDDLTCFQCMNCDNVISVKKYNHENIKIVYTAIIVKSFKHAIELLSSFEHLENVNITRWNYGSSFEDF